MVVNNKNTSPKKNIDNEQMEKGLILDNDKLENIELKILTDYLSQLGIIEGFNLDRVDNNTDTVHSHFYFNSKVNNNTLNTIFNNYIENSEIDINKIQKLSEEINKMKKINFLGVLDTSETIGDFQNQNELTQILGQDKTGAIIAKDINSNLGIDKNTIVKTFDYSIKLDSNENLDLAKIEKSFNDSFSYFKKNLSDINLQVTQKDNIINVKFDNKLTESHTQEKYGLTKGIVRIRLEEMLKNLQNELKNDKIELGNIGDFSKKVTTKEDVFNDLESTKVKSSVLTAQNSPLTAQIQNNAPIAPVAPNNAQNSPLNSVKISFINEIEKLDITELQNKKAELEEVVKKLEDVNNILKNPDIEKQINETKEEIKAIENQNLNLENVNELIENNKKLTDEVKYYKDEIVVLNDTLKQEQEEHIKTLEEKIKILEEVVKKDEIIENINNENIELKKENKTLQDSKKELEIEVKELSKNIEQIKELNKDLTIANESLTTANKVLNENLDKKDNEIKGLKDEIQKMKVDFESLNNQKILNDLEKAFIKEEDKKISLKDEIHVNNANKAIEYMSNFDITEDKKTALETLLKAKNGDLLEFGKSIKIHKNEDKSISNIEILDKNFENKTLEEKESKNRNRE